MHAKDSGWQWGVQSCIISRMPTHLVQELNVGTVVCHMVYQGGVESCWLQGLWRVFRASPHCSISVCFLYLSWRFNATHCLVDVFFICMHHSVTSKLVYTIFILYFTQCDICAFVLCLDVSECRVHG